MSSLCVILALLLAFNVFVILGLIKSRHNLAQTNAKLNDEIETLLKVFRNLNQLQDENLEMYIRMLQQASQHHNQNQLF